MPNSNASDESHVCGIARNIVNIGSERECHGVSRQTLLRDRQQCERAEFSRRHRRSFLVEVEQPTDVPFFLPSLNVSNEFFQRSRDIAYG